MSWSKVQEQPRPAAVSNARPGAAAAQFFHHRHGMRPDIALGVIRRVLDASLHVDRERQPAGDLVPVDGRVIGQREPPRRCGR
jgi:hypothetical protein